MRATDLSSHPQRVLIVDDERANRDVLEAMLADQGYTLETAASGKDALAIMALRRVDLILLDVMMLEVDGYQVARRLKEDEATRSIPIIMITALDNREARILGLEAGAADFLSKPVDRAELCVRVKNLLQLKAYAEYYDRYRQQLESEVAARTAQLAASERRFREVTETIREVFWLVDARDGTMLYVSPAYEAIWGRSVKNLRDAPGSFLDAVHPEDRARVEATIARQPEGWEQEYRIVRPDGAVRWIRDRGYPVRGEGGAIVRVVGVADDVTERRLLEDQYRQSQKMESLGQLAAGVAHDFNNMLTIISGYSELVLGRMEPDDSARGLVQEIKKAADRSSTLTAQLLLFSRKQLVATQVLDLNAVVDSADRMLRRMIGEDIRLASALRAGGAMVRADAGQIEQVLMNLTLNARDAMPQGGKITLETRQVDLGPEYASTHAGVVPGRYVLLAVSDTGSGMTAAVRNRVFEPFFTTKGAGRGTGLGLAVVHGIVTEAGGHIEINSELGVGTTFKVYLPSVLRPAEAGVALATCVKAPNGTETVLLVEDEVGLRGFARHVLSARGYVILEAGDGHEGLALAVQYADTIHLLVTDVVMPGMGGRQLADRVVDVHPETRVLYLPGYTDDAVLRHGVLQADVQFLEKPFSSLALALKVRAVLDS